MLVMVAEKKKHDQNSEACSYEGTLYIEVPLVIVIVKIVN